MERKQLGSMLGRYVHIGAVNEFQGLSVLYLDTTPLEVCVCVYKNLLVQLASVQQATKLCIVLVAFPNSLLYQSHTARLFESCMQDYTCVLEIGTG